MENKVANQAEPWKEGAEERGWEQREEALPAGAAGAGTHPARDGEGSWGALASWGIVAGLICPSPSCSVLALGPCGRLLAWGRSPMAGPGQSLAPRSPPVPSDEPSAPPLPPRREHQSCSFTLTWTGAGAVRGNGALPVILNVLVAISKNKKMQGKGRYCGE